MDLFTLTAKLSLDTSDYEQKIADVVKAAQTAGKQIDEALGGSSSGGTTGSPASGAGGTGLPATSTGGGASGSGFGTMVKGILTSKAVQRGFSELVKTGKEAVEVASDLVEVQNVVDVTFGASAAKVDQWARTRAQNFGLSELQAKQFSGYFGAMLQTSGIDQATAAEMAVNLSERVGDLASFYNIDIEDSYRKVLSGMSGEREPLLRYGLDLGADSVGEYAGMKLSDMENSERYQARYNYLMDKSAFLSGDYTRTSDELANSLRTLDNNGSRLLASMGQKVMPVLKAGTNAANALFAALYDESAEKSLAAIDQAAIDTVSNIEDSADLARTMTGVLTDYGEKSELTADKQKQWESVAGELVRTIPELGDLINLQTGEIEGGTAALEENIAAWEEAGKIGAQTSALEAKRSMLDSLSTEIAKEQGLLDIAESEMAQHANDAADIGEAVAQKLGVEFDGTVESFKALIDSVEAFSAANSLGFKDADIFAAVYDYNQASKDAEGHKANIASLQEEYATVESSISESASAIGADAGSMAENVSSSFSDVETATESLVSSFDQSDFAYANAYNTGLSAANGLNAAYGAYASAANAYSFRASALGLGGTPGGIPGFATGLDYVPYDEFPALLHEGEAVLTSSEAQNWRNGNHTAASTQDIANAVARAVEPLYQAISNIQIVMDHRAVGNAVAQTVSENIARQARELRNSL